MSRIGRLPIAIPSGVDVKLDGRQVDVKGPKGSLALTVADTGTGMTHDVYTRCTELFFTTKRNGSGIGLALVRQAVTEAGGELEIESVPGFGTCITALVPVIAAPRISTPEEGTHVSRR